MDIFWCDIYFGSSVWPRLRSPPTLKETNRSPEATCMYGNNNHAPRDGKRKLPSLRYPPALKKTNRSPKATCMEGNNNHAWKKTIMRCPSLARSDIFHHHVNRIINRRQDNIDAPLLSFPWCALTNPRHSAEDVGHHNAPLPPHARHSSPGRHDANPALRRRRNAPSSSDSHAIDADHRRTTAKRPSVMPR